MAANINDKFSRVISGTTRPVATTLSAQKTSGATTASVVATTGWDNTTAVHGIMYRTDSSNNKVPGSQIDWKGTFSGTTISNFTVTAGSDDTYAVGTTVELSPTAAWADDLVGGILVEHDQDGTHGDVTANSIVATTGTFTNLTINGTSGADGWSPLGQSLTSITALGNRSYTAVVSGTDTTGVTSVGMRLKLPRTVTAPTYMGGAFNGSSHYFTKVTPTGTLSTITNNFTFMAHIEPTAYQIGVIAGRQDAGSNWMIFRLQASGQLMVGVGSGGAGNYREVYSYQSVPLNKKTHVAATWTGGTVVLYFDGVSVPVTAAVTSGTAPTTAGTGGDFSIGRPGAASSQYFPGYISSVGVFDAVLTQATIRLHMNQALTGGETNCIGAWNLNNAATDASAAANNLTATGGVGYTLRTPYTNSVTGTSITAGTTNYGIIMAQTFSTNTTYTIQIPEGETLPTTGGIGTVSYSTQKTPYGFPGQKAKWDIEVWNRADNTSPTNSTFNHNITLNVPVGEWDLGYELRLLLSNGVQAPNAQYGISTSSGSLTNKEFNGKMEISTTNSSISGMVSRNNPVSIATATPYYTVTISGNSGTLQSIRDATDGTASFVRARNAYL